MRSAGRVQLAIRPKACDVTDAKLCGTSVYVVARGELMPLYNAHEVFKLEKIGPEPGMPCWANLRAIDHPDCTVARADLLGPGIYALFLDGECFYIGLHAPASKPVTVRWHKHIVAHTLRASHMFMGRSALLHSLTLPGPVGAGLCECLSHATANQFRTLNSNHKPLSGAWRRAMRTLILVGPTGVCAPLITRRYNTTFNKARFAEAHWGLLGPGNEKTMLCHITCGYERLLTETDAVAQEVKYDRLKKREDDLIDRFKPICNRETKVGEEQAGITWLALRQAILDAFAAPNPYQPHKRRVAT